MKEAIRLVLQDEATRRLMEMLPGRRLRAGGLTEGASSVLASAVNIATGRSVLIVTPHIDLAEDLYENATVFGEAPGLLEPRAAATSFQKDMDETAAAERVRLLERYIPGGKPPGVVVASAAALLEGVTDPKALQSATFELGKGRSYKMEDISRRLVEHGFTREYEAERPWQFAARGGILDVFAPGRDKPVRVEFFGDEVESIRAVDTATGRSAEELLSVTLVVPKPTVQKGALAPFTRYLDENTIVFVLEPPEVQRAAQAHIERYQSLGVLLPFAQVWKELERFTLVETSAFHFSDSESVSFETRNFSIAAQDVEGIVAEFTEFAQRMHRTIVFALNVAEKARLEELFAARRPGGKAPFHAFLGRFNRGFYFADRGLAFIGHQDIFHRYRMRRRLHPAPPARPITSLLELAPGDYVVHNDHGIARFRGMQIVDKEGQRREYLALEFAGKTKLLVPVSHLDLVSKYTGATERPPGLNAIGGKGWQARKARVARAVRDLAAELLRLQALRQTKPGIEYKMDERYQSEFEEEFIYEETDDQLKALSEIKGDMLSDRPTDRLLCGDVGFGKTELAIRAAFIAVSAGYQVAVLVPTTVLAEQHFRTFSERMADYPILIEVLSRLRSKAEQRATLERLRRKQVDIVIGTHRLVQRDVMFADLGLVIIDEEQRFGVEHKERLKRFRETVDVLTLTATPIPRTMHMALVGLRDISVLSTPPQERQAISTFVGHLSEERLREVILRELGREGQVYFVHNRVQSIEKAAQRVHEAVPEARITIAHGQMNEHLLENRMLDFIAGKYDVLVATTIIESGLDIPNVNTIVIDQSDMYGLADLHQLRGRVGRYKHRAYAYFLLPEGRPISPEGYKRLEAIEHFSELGAGFRIAMRDMEIRGVGNVLGKEQSGHIAAVGYELYCRLLSEAVAGIKGGKASAVPEAYIEFQTSSFIPQSYVESPAHRLDLYKRLSSATTVEEVASIETEMQDRFGPLPGEAEEFILTARLRVLLYKAGIRMVMTHQGRLVVQAQDVEAAARVFQGKRREARVVDERTVHVIFEGGMPEGVELLKAVIGVLQGRSRRI